ncbi:MAG: DUF5658 family protein [Planctomycetaceae bacterium]|nr:DUF5658 family protein [Planctomycetaceae bacterium]
MKRSKPAVPSEHEFTLFILVSAFDLFMTYLLLYHGGFRESNPLAQFFIARWGVKGMVYYKFGMVAVICTIAYIVGQHRPVVARRLLQFATLVVAAVVAYSVVLFVRHGGGWPNLG